MILLEQLQQLGGVVAGSETPAFTVTEKLLHMVVAGILAAIIAYRPWRHFISHTPLQERETADSQIMIAVAGAIMVAIIGDSVARAFGLVGLGGLVRFRATIRDTRDAALMFMMIAIGMACGLGFMALAIGVALFVLLFITVFDYTDRTQITRISVRVDEPRAAVGAIRHAFPRVRILEAPNTKTLSPGASTVVLELNGVAVHHDAAEILDLLRARGVPGVRNVAVEDDD